MNLNFSPFPLLSTVRLALRQLVSKDAECIHQLRSHPEVNKYLGRNASQSIEDAKVFIQKIDDTIGKNEGVYWVITLKESGAFVGTICLYNFDIKEKTVEIGYELLPVYQGMGIMHEAIREVIKFSFEIIGAKTITACPSAKNSSSVKLLEKSTFKLVTNGDDNEDILTYILKKH